MKDLDFFTQIPEEDLIDAARSDADAFGILYERYVDRIYNYVYFRVGNVQDAEDITAKVFFKALNAISSYRHMGLPFSSWLYRIAHNQVANFHRDRSRSSEIALDSMLIPPATPRELAPEAALDNQEEFNQLMRIVNDLSEQKRELVMLKFVQKLSNEEIGRIFNKSEGAIKSLYHRTLLELRDRFNKS
jgi:RNA polymerase sigma-70 factor (ECF subfamily)